LEIEMRDEESGIERRVRMRCRETARVSESDGKNRGDG
jgi:hypothetical protein